MSPTERLKAAGRLEEFEARQSQLRNVTAAAKTDATKDQTLPDEQAADVVLDERVRMAAELVRRIDGLHALLKRLPPGRRCVTAELYDWVGEHLECDAAEIEEATIPNRLALRILIAAIESPEGFERFISRHKAVCGGETAQDVLKRFEDDGRDFTEFWAKFERNFKEEKRKEFKSAMERLSKRVALPKGFVAWANAVFDELHGPIDAERLIERIEVEAQTSAQQSV
jgi:hypothetical protein